MNSMVIIDVIIIIIGVYMIYTSIQMKRTNKINNIIVDEQIMRNCKDEKGFVAYLFPRMLSFSIILVAVGIVRLLADTIINIGYFAYAVVAVALISFLLFFKQLSDGKNKFC